MKKGWEIKKLGEVCDIINGGTPKTNIDEYWNGNINWITPKDMGKLTSKYVYETERNITELGLKKSSAKLIPKNSIILSSRAPIGHLAINKVEISTNQGCKGIIPLNINEHYIYYFLLNSVEYLDSLGSGTTFKELSNTKLSEVLIPIPPIKEQEEIVERLDKGFELIDSLKETAKKNLDNAKELFQSVLREELSPKEGWETKTLENCFKLKSGNNLTSKDMIIEGSYPVYGGNGIAGYYNDYNLEGENIIVGRVGALCGNVRQINEKIWLTDNAFKITDYMFDYNLSYLTYLLNYINLRGFARQAAQPVISNNSLKDVLICFPKSIKEQEDIVNRLDRIKGYCEELEGNYKRVLELCEELKQGLLREAFSY